MRTFASTYGEYRGCSKIIDQLNDSMSVRRCTTQLKSLNLTKLLWPREDNIIFVANGYLNSSTVSMHDVKQSVPTNTEDYQEIVSTKKDISTVKEFKISFQRIPKVDRVVEIQCDQLAESFVVLQVTN